jgi:hypothetical protein
MPSVLVCPDPTCQAPAEIIGQWTLDSTDGPVEHVKTRCAVGHVFTPRTRIPCRDRRRRGSPPCSQIAVARAARGGWQPGPRALHLRGSP